MHAITNETSKATPQFSTMPDFDMALSTLPDIDRHSEHKMEAMKPK